MQTLTVCAALIAGFAAGLTGSAAAATLNKCVDAQGQITYSNLPCNNARETRKIEIDLVQPPDPVRKPPVKPVTASPATKPEPRATVRLETQTPKGNAPRTSARQCDTLSDKLGKVLDKMDAARRQGYTQKQMNDWNDEVEELERKKQQSGCF